MIISCRVSLQMFLSKLRILLVFFLRVFISIIMIINPTECVKCVLIFEELRRRTNNYHNVIVMSLGDVGTCLDIINGKKR